MASFARFGVYSGAACGALAEDFLRGECGMKGIIVTDAYGDMNGSQNIEPYFEMVYGIYYGGSDIPDGSQPQAEEHFDKFKKNYSQMAWQMRKAAKRVLYQTAWSNAVNGMDSESEIEKIVPEWQKALFLADKIVYVLFALCALWTCIAVVKEEKVKMYKKIGWESIWIYYLMDNMICWDILWKSFWRNFYFYINVKREITSF